MRNFLKSIIDFLFPIECAGCGEEGKWLCDYCFSKIIYNEIQSCPLCGKEFKTGYSCVCVAVSQQNDKTKKQLSINQENLPSFNCGGAGQEILNLKSFVDVYITFVDLEKNRQVKELIYKLKYNFVEKAAEDLARIGVEFLKRNWTFSSSGRGLKNLLENAIFAPVPLHKQRFLWRGFNQSELILRELAKEQQNNKITLTGDHPLGVAIKQLEISNSILIRIKNTLFHGQGKMAKNERHKNMKDGFVVAEPEKIRNRAVVLFDDVITSGATMEECARMLKLAGAGRVIAMAAGKG